MLFSLKPSSLSYLRMMIFVLFILEVGLSCQEEEFVKPPSNSGVLNYDMNFIGDVEVENVVAIRGFKDKILVVSNNGGLQFHLFNKSQLSTNYLKQIGAFANPQGVHYVFGNHYTISQDAIAVCSQEGQLFLSDFMGSSIYTLSDRHYSLAYAKTDLALAFSSDQSLSLFSMGQSLNLLKLIPTNKEIQAITFFNNRFLVFFQSGYGIIDVSNLTTIQLVLKGNIDFKNIQFVVVNEDNIDIEGPSKESGYRRIGRVSLDAYGEFHYIANNEMLSDNHISFSSSGNKYYVYRKNNDIQVLKNETGSIESYRILPLYDTPQWKITDSCGIYIYQDVIYTSFIDQSAIRVFKLGE